MNGLACECPNDGLLGQHHHASGAAASTVTAVEVTADSEPPVIGPCSGCGAPAIVSVGSGDAMRPVCIRCFGGLLRVARAVGDLARDQGVDVVVHVGVPFRG